MELKEAIKIVKEIITHKDDVDIAYGTKITRPYTIDHEQIQAIETVLQALENSISKKNIEDEIEDWKNVNKLESKALYNQDELVKIIIKILQELLEDK